MRLPKKAKKPNDFEVLTIGLKELAPLLGALVQIGVLKAGAINTTLLKDYGSTLAHGIACNIMNFPRQPEQDADSSFLRYEEQNDDTDMEEES